MTPHLHDLILRRLTSTGVDQHAWSFLILAALESPESLDGCLAGTQSPTPPKRARKSSQAADAKPTIEPPGVYLGAITVAGFRGIGPSTTLPLQPGPGLTLVVGRNGSGKSSFAEGAEVLLTGTSLRWEGRNDRRGAGHGRGRYQGQGRQGRTRTGRAQILRGLGGSGTSTSA